MKTVSAGRFSDLGRALFDLLETEPFEVENDMRPVVVFEGERLEHSFVKLERLYGGAILQQAAVAAQFGFSGVVVPLGSVGISVVEFAELTAGSAAADLFVGFGPGPTLTGETLRQPFPMARDTRGIAKTQTVPNGLTYQVRGASAAGILSGVPGSLVHVLPAPAAAFRSVLDPRVRVVLGAGGFCVFQTQVVNTLINAQMAGYERATSKANRL